MRAFPGPWTLAACLATKASMAAIKLHLGAAAEALLTPHSEGNHPRAPARLGWCAEHDRPCGGANPLPNLVEVKGARSARAAVARRGLKEARSKGAS
jgi:hypothetical protein